MVGADNGVLLILLPFVSARPEGFRARFEPSGFTHHPQIRYAKSIADYLFRWMACKFLGVENPGGGTSPAAGEATQPADEAPQAKGNTFVNDVDAPPCPECGSLMTRNGSCYRCLNCGSTSGCS